MLFEWPEVGHALGGSNRGSWGGHQFTGRHLWNRKGLRDWKIIDRGAHVLNLGHPDLAIDGGAFGDGHK